MEIKRWLNELVSTDNLFEFNQMNIEPKRLNPFIQKLISGRKNLFVELKEWLKIISSSGLWAFFPVIIGVFIGYWCEAKGCTQEIVKYYTEIGAVILMSLTVLIFFLLVALYRLKTDIVLLIVSIGFLCREIHFVGTDSGVVVVAVIAGLLAWWWRDDILDELAGKNQWKAAIFCMCWSYLVTILIQRRVFKTGRIPLLPHEELIHISLEEITEDVAHLVFLAVGVIGFLYLRRKRNLDKPQN